MYRNDYIHPPVSRSRRASVNEIQESEKKDFYLKSISQDSEGIITPTHMTEKSSSRTSTGYYLFGYFILLMPYWLLSTFHM
jgi:hypothetical protein